MTDNPFASPAVGREPLPAPYMREDRWFAKVVTRLTLFVAIAAAAWILLMLKWLSDERPSTTFSIVTIASVWLTAPYVGFAGLALLFQRSAAGALVALLGTLASGGLGSVVYYNSWSLHFQAPLPGAPEMMNCGPPLELFFPVAQWMGVAMTAIAAAFISWIAAARPR